MTFFLRLYKIIRGEQSTNDRSESVQASLSKNRTSHYSIDSTMVSFHEIILWTIEWTYHQCNGTRSLYPTDVFEFWSRLASLPWTDVHIDATRTLLLRVGHWKNIQIYNLIIICLIHLLYRIMYAISETELNILL